MPESNYLDGAQNLYGLPSPLPQGLGEQASAIVDSYLNRTEGLLYVADKNGNPAFMRALNPSFTYTLPAGASPGSNVTVQIAPANARIDMLGEVLTLDRKNPDLLESCVVTAVVDAGHVTLASVQFTHASAATADVGLVITEERSLPAKRSIARYSRYPLANMLSLMGRYGYSRRSQQVAGMYQEANLLASAQAFGGPPQWIPINSAQASFSDASGEVWVPAGMLLAYYSDVKMKYVAGFITPPDPIVRATANIAKSLSGAAATYGGGVRVIQAGDQRIERFGSTNIDDDSKNILDSFKARLFY